MVQCMTKKWLLAGLVIAVATGAFGQARKYSNDFLSIGVGARAFAMGSAATASTNDVTSAYWNPAGLLGNSEPIDIALMHNEYFAGMAKYDYGAVSYKPDENSALAFSLIRLAFDNIPNTLNLMDESGNIDFNRITYFTTADYAFLLSYARKTTIPGLSIGGNAKIVRRITGEFASAWGFGLDMAVKYEHNGWQLGAMARDITSTFNAWQIHDEKLREVFEETGNEIPQNSLELTLPQLQLGVARLFNLGRKFTALPEAGFDVYFDGQRNAIVTSKLASVYPKLGAEFGYNDLVFLRMGVGNFQKISDFDNSDRVEFQPNIGVGIKYKRICVDYALTDLGNVSSALYSNVFSLRYSFGL